MNENRKRRESKIILNPKRTQRLSLIKHNKIEISQNKSDLKNVIKFDKWIQAEEFKNNENFNLVLSKCK